MSRNSVKFLLFGFLICLCSVGGTYILNTYQQKQIAVVDAVRLFNEYTMKKELEHRAEGRLRFLTQQLDSIAATIKEDRESVHAKAAMERYSLLQQQIEYEYTQSNQQINEMVWKRLNPLVDQYGKENKLRLMIGANGMGSVLYYNEYFDLTDDLIRFVNKKYENDQ